MITIQLNTHIQRPIRDVFDYIVAPENNSRWQYGSMETLQITEGSVEVGTIFSSIGHFMGRRIQTVLEVTEFQPNLQYGFKTLAGPVQLQSSYRFETVNHGTKVAVLARIKPDGFFNPVDSIVFGGDSTLTSMSVRCNSSGVSGEKRGS